MDKFEYRIRAEEINALIEKKQYIEAARIADTIDWSRVKSVMMLCKISDLYKNVRRFEDAKEVLLLAYDRQPGGRKIVYSLCELAIKLEETVQAVEYYKEFVQIAPTDTRRFLLQYRLYEAQDVSLEERIAVLEEYKKRDYREKWAYELAYLYHRIGLATRCVEECDELILWFGEGKYVTMAMELKMLHAPLSPSQQEKYDKRFMKEEEEEEAKQEEAENSLPIEIKAVDVTKAKTAEIIPEQVEENLAVADTVEVPDVKAVAEKTEQETPQDEPAEAVSEDVPAVEEIPLVEPDLDIQVKTVDVGEYNTINLQQELAQNISRMFAEEDMEAADATMALPIDTIIDTANNNEKVISSITDDAIKDALLAPFLKDNDEPQPITEEDLLASMEQERLEKERLEAERLEAERVEKERLEAERLEAERLEKERLEAERLEAERVEKERLEAERLEAERLEAERLEKERLEAERLEAERLEAERLEKERLEAERLEAERLEAERLEAERLEAERLEKERLEAERLEAERLEKERLEAERLEAERLEAERLEKERLEAERLEAERLEKERLEAERLEAERLEKERLEAERLEAERLEAERLEKERLEAERLEAERLEKERLEAERLEAERLEKERLEAERLEAERLEKERLEAEKVAAPVTAGAIMAAEIAHAVTTGNTGSLNIGQVRTDVPIATGDPMIDEQISGQLSLLDIMSEWEETKKANEEKRIAQMREKVMKQTGPMFSNFDEVARASVATDLDLINPAVDVFKEREIPVKNEEKEILQDVVDEVEEEPVAEETSEPSEVKKVFNTEEINGIEEKLIEALAKAEEKEEPIPTFVPDIDFDEIKEEKVEEKPKEERVIIAEEVVTTGSKILSAMVAAAEEKPAEEPAVTPVAEEEPVVAEAPIVTPVSVTEPAVTPVAAEEPVVPVVAEAPIVTPVPVTEPAVTSVAVEVPTVTEEAPTATAEAPAVTTAEPVSYEPHEIPQPGEEPRLLTKEEKELFGTVAPTKELQEKTARVLDLLTLYPSVGNAIVVGENGTGRDEIAKNLVKQLQRSNPAFSGEVAKISGKLLATKDIPATLASLENGALIIESAGELEMDILGILLYQLERAPLKGIFVVLEDRNEEIRKLTMSYPQINRIFNAKFEIEVLDNNGLVNFAKEYARSREYTIDEMGVLAIHTRISDKQTNEHAVTISEVKNMVDDAIENASRKSVKHFMDVIIGKRFDDDDMIILREKDFSIE